MTGFKDFMQIMQYCACIHCSTVCNPCSTFDVLSTACLQCLHNALIDPMCSEADRGCNQNQLCQRFSSCAYGCL